MDVKASAVIKHNSKWYKPGEDLKKLKKEDGERLIELGVAAEIKESEAEKKAREKAEKEAADKKAAEEKAKADEAEKGK